MRVIYGMLYYYLLAVVGACFLLVLLVPKFSRKLFFKIYTKLHLGPVSKYIFFGIMVVNLMVLVDSVNSYIQYRDILSSCTCPFMQKRWVRWSTARWTT